MALTQEQVAQLYVSLFGRAPEGKGSKFWQENGTTVEDTANWMLATDDAKEYFGDTYNDNQAFVEFIYLNTLNKEASDDPEGIAFWVDMLNNGASKGEMVNALIYAAATIEPQDDKTAEAQAQFKNRVEVAVKVSEEVEEAPENYKEVLGFKTPANPNALLEVTSDPASVEQALEVVEELVVAGDSAEDTADQAGDSAEDTADEAEDQADESADEAEDQADESADEAEDQADESADEAEDQADESADEAEDQADESADEAEDTADESADEAEDTADESADEAEDTADESADEAEDTAEEAEETAEEMTEIVVSEVAPEPEGEEVAAGTVIATVEINSDYAFSLEGDDADMFELDITTGEIKVAEAYTPDFEEKDAYNFTIKAIGPDGSELVKDITIPVEDLPIEPLELTDGDDNLSEILSDGDDTIVAALGTVGNGDVISDPSTKDNDILEMTVDKDDLAPTIVNVENINLTGEYAKVGLDLGGVIGAKEVTASANIIAATATFTGVSSVATEKIVIGENVTNVNITAAESGTKGAVAIDLGDAKDITLTDGGGTDSFAIELSGGTTDVTYAGSGAIETLTVNSVGSANTLTLTGSGDDASIGELVIEGDQDFSLAGDVTVIGAADSEFSVTNNGEGLTTFVANGAGAAATSDISKVAFDVIDLKQDLGGKTLTVNEESELLIDIAQTDNLTVNVNNADGNLATGDGTLKLDVAVGMDNALIAGAQVGTLILNQDTADVAIASLETNASAVPTVVITGDKNVEITNWVNASEQVLTAGNLEGDLTVALKATAGGASAATAGATVISGVGNDTITIGAGAAGEEYTVVTNDGNDTVNIPTGFNSGAEATIVTGAGDDIVNLGTASGMTMANITIDGGDGADQLQFALKDTESAAGLTIGADASIAGVEKFVDIGTDGGATLVIKSMDVLAGMEEFVGASAGGDTLKIVGGAGDDNIDLGAITLTNATDAVQGGGGNDTVTFVKDDLAGETFIFEADASSNGVDTLNNFVVGGVNGDILDFSKLLSGDSEDAGATAGTGDVVKDSAGNALTANLGDGADAIDGKIALLVDIEGGQDITTADGLKEAIASGGEYSNVNLDAGSAAIIITSATNKTDDSHIFYVKADDEDASVIDVVEVGLVAGVDIDNFTGGDAGESNFMINA